MKRYLLIFGLVAVIHNFVSLPDAYAQTGFKLSPIETDFVFNENGQEFAYLEIDSVFISIGFNNYYDNEIILDITIDNQSSDTIVFNPQSVYMFRYSEDSLLEKKLYYAINPEEVLDSIQYSQFNAENRLERNLFFKILAGAAYLTTEIAGIAGDIDYDVLEAIRFTHTVVQAGLDHSRYNTEDKLYNLDFAGDYWSKGAIRKTRIYPYSFESGKLHFNSPEPGQLKIYVPVEEKIYRFIFKNMEI